MTLNYRKLIIVFLLWLFVLLFTSYFGFVNLLNQFTGGLMILSLFQLMKLINFYRFRKPMTESAVIFFSCLLIIVITSLTDIRFKLNYFLLKSSRLCFIEKVERGTIKPNVEGTWGLYEPKFEFPRLSNWYNRIGLDNLNSQETRVTFFITEPGSYEPRLVYSKDKLFNRRVEYLISKDNGNHEKLDEFWYRTNYNPGVSIFKDVEKTIK